MLSEETQTADIVESKQIGLLSLIEVQKNLQIVFSNQTTQVCYPCVIIKIILLQSILV